ncbi:uncharacterized protein [Haliotis asinina]|uniref:uncharacterized protein n=1 Tax=Haliotis asinina TaxID=109174 RepID=UPI003531B601
MEDTLGGVVAASIICCVMLIITIVAIYYTFRRCRGFSDKESQEDPLINGNVRNGSIPTVARPIPYPLTPPTRDLYQFPTMPTRHMASYRPRYIEERAPAASPKQDGTRIAVRAHTYNGPYQQPETVVYDVTQPRGLRNERLPLWAQKSQGEATATMTLGEESPVASADQIQRNDSVKRTSVNTDKEFTFREKRSSRTEDIVIPSPDETRKEYLFTKEKVSPKLSSASQAANEVPQPTSEHYADIEQANDWRQEVTSARQRRPMEGELPEGLLPAVTRHHTKTPHRAYTPPMEQDEAVFVRSMSEPQVPNDNIPTHPVKQYYFTNDMYSVSSKHRDVRGGYVAEPSSGYPAMGTFAPSVSSPDVNQISPYSRDTLPDPLDTVTDPSVVWPPPNLHAGGVGPTQPNLYTVEGDYQQGSKKRIKESHSYDHRVIKSKRRPSWLRNAGALFSRAKRNK